MIIQTFSKQVARRLEISDLDLIRDIKSIIKLDDYISIKK
jgi:hypothetical protein